MIRHLSYAHGAEREDEEVDLQRGGGYEGGRRTSLVNEAACADRALTLELFLVRRECCAAKLFLLRAVVGFRQAMTTAKLEVAVGALADELDRGVAALLIGARTVLAALLGATTQTQFEMQRRFFLDLVVAQRAAVFELLAGKEKALLIGGDALLTLNLSLYMIHGI